MFRVVVVRVDIFNNAFYLFVKNAVEEVIVKISEDLNGSILKLAEAKCLFYLMKNVCKRK